MTEQPTEKKVKLSNAQVLQNHLWGLGAPVYVALTVWWYVNLVWYTRRKHNRFAGAPVKVMLFGADPEAALDILREYNLRYAYNTTQWAILDNKIGLLLCIMVSRASFDYVDCVLDAYQGVTFNIITDAGTKRGQGIRKPYAQRQPKTRQTKPNKVKLGKPYRGPR